MVLGSGEHKQTCKDAQWGAGQKCEEGNMEEVPDSVFLIWRLQRETQASKNLVGICQMTQPLDAQVGVHLHVEG